MLHTTASTIHGRRDLKDTFVSILCSASFVSLMVLWLSGGCTPSPLWLDAVCEDVSVGPWLRAYGAGWL